MQLRFFSLVFSQGRIVGRALLILMALPISSLPILKFFPHEKHHVFLCHHKAPMAGLLVLLCLYSRCGFVFGSALFFQHQASLLPLGLLLFSDWCSRALVLFQAWF